MHVWHINSEKDVGKINESIKKGSHVFILVYMVGCGPCNATRPEWAKLESALKEQYSNKNELVVVDVNKDFLSHIKHIGAVDGFPTIKYIGNNGATVESYENSPIKTKDRSVDSFINWIDTKINNTISTNETSSPHNVYKRIAKKRKTRNKARNKARNKSRNKSRNKTHKRRHYRRSRKG